MPTVADTASDFTARDRALARALRRELRAAGCFRPALARQVLHMCWVLAACAGAYLLLLQQPGPLARVAALLVLAFCSVQAGFIAHEVGHGAVRRNRRLKLALGQVFNTLLTALCYAHFQKIHLVHHAHCNQRERDVDMQSAIFSLYPEAAARKRSRLARLVTRHQRWLIWILVSLQGFTLKFDSLKTLAEQPGKTRLDQVFLLLHGLLWIGLPASLIGWQDAAINYLAMTWLIGPYLGAIFLVNHIGTEVIGPGEPRSLLRQRIETTRDLGESAFSDRVFGGMNHHIEHHLFPSIASVRLGTARPIVRAFCRRNGIRYRESGWLDAAREVSAYLGRVSRTAGPV